MDRRGPVVRRAAEPSGPGGARHDRESAIRSGRIRPPDDADDRRCPAFDHRGRAGWTLRRARDRDARTPDEELRRPAIAGAMDLDDVAADADEPPFVGRARRDAEVERRDRGRPEPADLSARIRGAPYARPISPLTRTGLPTAGAGARGQQDLDGGRPILDDDPPARGVEEVERMS